MRCGVSLLAAPEMCSESVVAASRKCLSWLTTTTTRVCHVELTLSSLASHSTAAMDRWFVGSSSRSTSGFAKSAAASAARTLHPPLSAFIRRSISASGKPRLWRSAWARPGAPSASICISASSTSDRRFCSAASGA